MFRLFKQMLYQDFFLTFFSFLFLETVVRLLKRRRHFVNFKPLYLFIAKFLVIVTDMKINLRGKTRRLIYNLFIFHVINFST